MPTNQASHQDAYALKSPRHLVWLQTGFIGDIVLTTGAIALAKSAFPNAQQHLITTPTGFNFLRDHPHLSSVHVFDKRSKSLIAAIGQIRHSLQSAMGSRANVNSAGSRQDVVLLQAHTSYRSSLLAWFLKIPTITFHESSLSFLAWKRTSRIAVFHESVRQALLLEPLGVKREDILGARSYLTKPDTASHDEWAAWSSQNTAKIIGISPGSVWGTKRWPRKGFASVLSWILLNTECRVVFLGSAQEADLCLSIINKVVKDGLDSKTQSERILNLAGKTSLAQLREVYPKLTAVLANDSSAVHFASAFQVPTVAMFGATIPQMGFAPQAPQSQSLGIALSCRPCSDHGPQTCPLGHFRCMKELPAADAIAALDVILKS